MNKFKGNDLTPTEKLVLMHINSLEVFPVYIRDIAKFCDMHYQSIYKVIFSLAEKDLVDLICENKRGVRVEVFKKGVLG